MEKELPKIDLPEDWVIGTGISKELLSLYKNYPVRLKCEIFVLCMSGEVEASVNLNRISVKANDMIALAPGSIIQIHNIEGDLQIYFLGFSSQYIEQAGQSHSILSVIYLTLGHPVIALRPEGARMMEQYLNMLINMYEHFTEKRLFTVADAVALPNVILLHSFTKVLALPGLRLGYLTACSLLTDTIRRQRIPWPVGTVGLAAVDYIARNPELLVFDLGALLNERQRVEQKLSALPAIDVWPSDSHILLARLRYGSVASLKAYLMKQHGLLIRDATNFEGLGNGCFRITVRSASENDCLIAAIKRWLSI